MTPAILLYLAIWGVSSLILGLTGAAKAIAARLGNPDAWECAVAGGPIGLVILVAASWPWAAGARRQAGAGQERA